MLQERRRNGGFMAETLPPACWKEAKGAQVPLNNSIIGNFRDAGERWNDGGIAPCPFERGGAFS